MGLPNRLNTTSVVWPIFSRCDDFPVPSLLILGMGNVCVVAEEACYLRAASHLFVECIQRWFDSGLDYRTQIAEASLTFDVYPKEVQALRQGLLYAHDVKTSPLNKSRV